MRYNLINVSGEYLWKITKSGIDVEGCVQNVIAVTIDEKEKAFVIEADKNYARGYCSAINELLNTKFKLKKE